MAGRTYGKAAWRISRHRPPPATIERRALFHEYAHDAASAEGIRVHLHLDLQSIKRE